MPRSEVRQGRLRRGQGSTHFWQFDTNGKHTDGDDHPRHLQRYLICGRAGSAAPSTRVEEAESMWADDDSDHNSDRRFTNVELLLDDYRELAWSVLSIGWLTQ